MCSNKPKPKILLVRPKYTTRLEQGPWLATEPLDLEYLAAVANEQGCEWIIYDHAIAKESFTRVLKTFNPTVVAITGYYPAKDRMIRYAQQVKRTNKKILTLIGGVHAEVNHADFHCDAIDIVVHSGGANTFGTILQTIQDGRNPREADGICCRAEDGSWYIKQPISFDPATLPLPDRSHFNKYREHFSYLHYGPTALLKTAYGCPFDCKFCYCRELNNRQYTERKLEDVVAEIKEIQCGRIWIVDDTFLLDMNRIRRFADLLEQEGVHKQFLIYSRSEFIAKNPSVVPLLKKIGVIDVIIGFESINEDILNSYNKRVAEAESRLCIKLLNEAGIKCTGLFIMNINATPSQFRDLDRWIHKVNLTTYTLSIFTPYPGTEPFDQYKDQLTTTDCRKWDLGHLVMAPTNMRSATFYLLILWMHVKMLARNSELRSFVLSSLFQFPIRKKNIWDFWASRYETLWVQRFSLGPTRRKIINHTPVYPDMKFLDIGCGTGQLLGDLEEHFKSIPFSYTGIDQSPEMIKTARTKHPTGNFFVTSASEFHAPEKTYDLIICTHAFPYFPDKKSILNKMATLLKDGGSLLIAQASMNNPYDAVMLSLVKLTTTKAQYPSCRKMRHLAAPFFVDNPEEIRISPNRLIPSIYLFKWTKSVEENS